MNAIRKCLEGKIIRFWLKTAVSAVILSVVGHAFFIDGLEPYYTFQEGSECMTHASFFELAFSFLVYLVLTLTLCYAIFNIEKIMKAWSTEHSGISFLYAIYFAVSLVMVFNPLDAIATDVESFGRVIGAAFIANIDVKRRISNFNHWYVFFAVALAFFYALAQYCRQKKLRKRQKAALNILDQAIVLADVNLFLRCVTYFSERSSARAVFHYSTNVLMLIVLLGIAYIAFDLGRVISTDGFIKLLLMSFCMGYPLAIISQREWQDGRLLFGYQVVVSVIVIMLAYILLKKECLGEGALSIGACVLSLIPIATSFFIEFANILNQHEIFVRHPQRCYALMALVIVAVAAALSFVVGRRNAKCEKWRAWSYLWFLFGVTCLQQQIPLEDAYSADVFESANASILISDFLNFGDIPIVQHYGGHMMTGVWEGLIYAILNNDPAGAVFSPYKGYLTPVLAVLFFLLIKKILGDEIALLASFFFPFMGAWSAFGLGMLVCLAVWNYLEKKTYLRAVLVWLAFTWTALYRLDLGFSIGTACMAALAVYVIANKDWHAAKQLSVTLLVWGASGGILWSIICLIKHVNPLTRLVEFLLISYSNQNWAYAGVGNAGNTLFSWGYLIVPFAIASSLCYCVLSRKFREGTDPKIWLALLILGFSYFTNFSRGLVRHSLAETNIPIVFWDAFIYLAIFIATCMKKKELLLPSFMILIMSGTVLTTTANYNASVIGDNAASRLGDFTQGWTFVKQEKANRVEWTETLRQTIAPYEAVIDELLEDDETFVDFMNRTFVYSAIGRRDPVYVSQSPLQLSGEFTQEMFVKEIEGVPLVLMPINQERAAYQLDGIANSYRCYKPAEYIYQNYVPLCRYENVFAVWCLPERYEEFKAKAANLIGVTDYTDALYNFGQVRLSSCERRVDEVTGERCIASIGNDPIIADIDNFMDLSEYQGRSVKITIEYATNVDGIMQMFYTSDKDEEYSEDKVLTVNISEEGTASFLIPITEYTRLRLDIPEKSTVRIRSLKVGTPVEYIDYGYDDPTHIADVNGNTWNTYDNGFHTYNLAYLPNIWAEYDNASENVRYDGLQYDDGYFVFSGNAVLPKEKGNYLSLHASYDGTDAAGNYRNDDETIVATVKVGTYEEGAFAEKYQYGLTLREGANRYLIRISNDYWWYRGGVNAVKIECNGSLYDVTMDILEGD